MHPDTGVSRPPFQIFYQPGTKTGVNTMKLNVLERLVVSSLLPEQGSFLNLKLIREAKEDLSFNEEEHKALEFKSTNGAINWNASANIIKDVQLGGVVRGVIEEALKDLDKQEKIEEKHFSLYQKFVLKEDN
jgi:hypothetical protein